MDNQQLFYLFERYLQNECSDDELKDLLDHFGDGVHEDELKALILAAINIEIAANSQPNAEVIESLRKVDAGVLKSIGHPVRTIRFRYQRYLVAASLLLFIGLGFYFYRSTSPPSNVNQLAVSDALPASDKATLKLADGRELVLGQQGKGAVLSDHGVTITEAEGALIYSTKDDELSTSGYNELSTPRGGYFNVVLPDGSKVWLNAATTLKYPTQFSADKRVVDLEGEAYFVVKKVEKPKGRGIGNIPFIVRTAQQEVEVLGTEFNVMAYRGMSKSKTTLSEGSVRVSQSLHQPLSTGNSKVQGALLKPGQQATFERGEIKVQEVDVENELGWKNGSFAFNDMPLIDVLKHLSNWYNVDIDQSKIPDTRYTVFILRQAKLSSVLQMLEETGNLKFQLNKKNQIVVTAKIPMPM